MRRRQDWTWAVILTTVGALAWPGQPEPAQAATPAVGYADALYVGGLTSPTGIAFLPDGRLIVIEKDGGVRVAESPPVASSAAPAGSIGVCTDSEMGLLGVAVDPDFTSNGRLFFYRTENVGGCASATGRSNQVVTATFAGGQIGPLTTLLTGIRTNGGNHDGGTLRVGPDGKLYVSVGDTGIGDGGAPGSSTNPFAGDLAALEGKILRLNLDGSIPSNNPFVGQVGARGEIFAYGLRNPFRMGFDPLSGRLWAGDVGQETIEELDVIEPGVDYGWPQCEGTLPMGCPAIGATGAPVHQYDRSGMNASITGGAFAVGGAQLGRYFFGDFVFGAIWVLDVNPARTGVTGSATPVVTGAAGPADFAFGPDGALYYVAFSAGEVRRVTHADFGTSTTTTSTTSTTSTTGATVSSTTTTLAPVCSTTPTHACVLAALDTLAGTIGQLGDLGPLDDKLLAGIGAARTRVVAAAGTTAAGASHRDLKRALGRLGAVTQLLNGSRARREIPAPTRRTLADDVATVRALLQTLRAAS